MVLTDAWQPEGVTRIFQDSVFMMPHLGVLSTVHETAASQIFDKDCLVRVGTVIAPSGIREEGEDAVEVTLKTDGEEDIEINLGFGEVKRIPLTSGRKMEAEIQPARGLDVGAGNGRTVTTTIFGGTVGVIIDTRGRPLALPEDNDERKRKLLQWIEAMDQYPLDSLKR
jgi:hypothetical protein